MINEIKEKVNLSNLFVAMIFILTYFFSRMQKFHRDLPPTPVFAYGLSAETATFPGPTIIARQGVPLYVKWENHLPNQHILPTDNTIHTAIPTMGGVPTVVHLHGSVHPPQCDGSAFAWFTRDYKEVGPMWTQTTYKYPNIQPPGNLWYITYYWLTFSRSFFNPGSLSQGLSSNT